MATFQVVVRRGFVPVAFEAHKELCCQRGLYFKICHQKEQIIVKNTLKSTRARLAFTFGWLTKKS